MSDMHWRWLIAAVVAVTSCGAASAADIAAGKVKATEVCAACHGVDGNSTVQDFPKLGGQHADYLAKTLRDYQSGLRKNPIMAGFAKTLSKQDIDNLAAYYGAQAPVVSATQ